MGKKRTTTRWMFRVNYRNDSYIRVGRVHNQVGTPADIIRYDVKSTIPGGSADFAVTVDEAATLAAGLNYVLASELGAKSQRVRKMFR